MLQVKLLGQFDVRLDGKRVVIPSRAGQSLFAYLVLNAGTPQRREKLAGMLWSETSEETARRNLRQELWRIRKALSAQVTTDAGYLVAEEITITFDAESQYWLDVAQFEQRDNGTLTTGELTRRIALYQGNLLPGFYDDWVVLERERLQALYEQQLQHLLEELIAQQLWSAVLEWSEKWIALGETPEPAYRALMLAYGARGDMAKVAATFQRCQDALRRELDVEPSAQTRELYQKLVRGETTPAVDLRPQHVVPTHPLPAAMDAEPAPGNPPFKGLQYFDVQDAELFFGREALTAQLVGRLRGNSFLVVVVGASGSGKSSIVRAGLIPALQKGEPLADGTLPPSDSTHWEIHIITPTAHPLETLATSLTRDAESVRATAVLLDDLGRDPRSLYLYLKRRSAHRLVVIDQFEELFTLCHDEFEREAFIDNLFTAVNRSQARAQDTGAPPLTLVLTLRADFYAHLAQYAELRDAVAGQQCYIGPMTSDELRQAIQEPARQWRAADGAAWEFEPGLVDLMLREVANPLGSHEPGALPLLSHALLETWKRRAGHTMTLKGYADAGGVRGAIAQTAETTYQNLSPEQQALARNIFIRLTELGEGTEDTRRRATVDELVSHGPSADPVRAVITTLADARLVTTSEQGVEVAHEALIREWHRLREWLNEDRDGLKVHRRLTNAAQEWELLERDASALYRGARLAQTAEWCQTNRERINELERLFLEASEEQEQKGLREREAQRQRELDAARKLAETEQRAHKQLRRRAVFLAGAFVLAIVLAAIALFFGEQARVSAVAAQGNAANAERQGRIATARELAASALGNLTVDPQRSILLALQAVKTTQEKDRVVLPQAEDALHRAVIASHVQAQLPFYSFTEKAPPTDVHRTFRASYSPDGSRIAMRGPGVFKILDAKTHQEGLNLPVSPAFGAAGLAYNTDGSQIATLDHAASAAETLVKIFDANSGKLLRETRLAQKWDDVFGVGFSPDLSIALLMPSGDAHAQVWDTTTGKSLLTLPVASGKNLFPRVTFSSDGKRVAPATNDLSLKIFDSATGKELVTLCCQGSKIITAAFSPDGKRIATGGTDNTVKVWDVETGKELNTLAGHSNFVTDVVWSKDGKRLASTSWDRKAIVWDANTGKRIYELPGHTDFVYDADFSSDGKTLLTASEDKTALLWDVGPSRELVAVEQPTGLFPAGYNADRSHFSTVDFDGNLKIWDAQTLQPRQTLTSNVELGGFGQMMVSPDEKLLASATFSHTLFVWDVASGKQILAVEPDKDVHIWGPSFSPDSSRVALPVNGPQGQQVEVWDISSRARLTTLSLGSQAGTYLETLAWSPDGKRLVGGYSNGLVRMWDAASGAHLFDLPGHTNFIWQILYSPDASKIATASRDGLAIIHDAQTGKELIRLVGHTSTVDSLDWSPDGKWIVTAGSDGTAKLWDAVSGEELLTFNQGLYPVEGAIFTADGKHIITTSDDGAIRKYTLDIAELVELAKARLIRTWRGDECQKFLHVEQCPQE